MVEFSSSKPTCEKERNVTYICNFIPESIPKGIENVHLKLEVLDDIALNSTTFISSGWDNVKLLELRADLICVGHLNLQDNCFKGLNRLHELRLHILCSILMFPKTFIGLDELETLNMSGSVRFLWKSLIPALNGSNKLPRLSHLILSHCSVYHSPFLIDDKFAQVLQTKKISYLDLSSLQLAKLNLTALLKKLKYLEVFNASYSTINEWYHKSLVRDDLKYVKTLDLSYVALPKTVFPQPFPGKLIISNASFTFRVSNSKVWLSPDTVNISGIVPHLTTIWIRNCTVTLGESPDYLTNELIFRKNNLKRLDLRLTCGQFSFSSFKAVDISDNGLQFIHPELLSCLPNLQKIDLSTNQLVKMTQESPLLFEKLFSRLKSLRNINLSRNELTMVPMKMFENNQEIEVVNLSNNKLEQVHFILTGLKMLRVVNLQGNQIHTLDQISTDILNGILDGKSTGEPRVTVNLNANPFSCSKCETKRFLSWLISANLVDVSSQTLKCSNEKGLSEKITEETLDEVEKICERKTIIISTSVSAAVIVVVLVLALLIFYLQRQHKRKLLNRKNLINLLRKGEGSYEFVVFLSFSNDDEDFVNTYILNPLNENLQLMTGIDRELVCTGDRHFRPGFYVHNEAYRGLDTTSVMVVVASKNFCRSSYCQNELDQAYVKKKPIILMFIEHIDKENMTPTIKELYQRNVRVLWTVENGEYKMKTTWNNVCTSILDLIQ
ncbi:toll-like receptor 2 [Mercenaria mercenaria]|uniref:toll-like receptor 2 n=1 Tax=Mercenaria mercenaria TaxID=6596 RepID=UPI00234E735E|nr:toll-like receptor 2 [Mercenaria mercenaria]